MGSVDSHRPLILNFFGYTYMKEAPLPPASKPNEAEWDRHSSYQWTYFAEPVKERISYFLSQRLGDDNLEVGGGWYLSHPGSTVVDISAEGLKHNPADHKIQFDLDDLGTGSHLPLPDDSFDSATFVSVWQYLEHPEAVLAEMARVIRPGGEMYLVHGRGAGIEELKKGASTPEEVQAFFQQRGLDTVMEDIPTADNKTGEFRSVCVAMPGANVFGETVSVVRNKAARVAENAAIQRDPQLFSEGFIYHDLHERARALSQLRTFPITQYSLDYRERIEAFTKEYQEKTGLAPLIRADLVTAPEIGMLIPERSSPYFTISTIGEQQISDSLLSELTQKHGIELTQHIGLLGRLTMEELGVLLGSIDTVSEDTQEGRMNLRVVNTLVGILASIGTNSSVRELQEVIYQPLLAAVPDLDERIKNRETLKYKYLTSNYKQKRIITDTIQLKQQIIAGEHEIVGEGSLDVTDIMLRMEAEMTAGPKAYERWD